MPEVMQDLTSAFRTALKADEVSEVDNITSRACSSDRYDGIEYIFHGYWVDATTLMKVVEQYDSHHIENLYYCGDGDGHLGLFVAYIPPRKVGDIFVDF